MVCGNYCVITKLRVESFLRKITRIACADGHQFVKFNFSNGHTATYLNFAGRYSRSAKFANINPAQNKMIPQ